MQMLFGKCFNILHELFLKYGEKWTNCEFIFHSIYLDHLKDPDSAVRLVKLSNSLEGARMVAR